MIIVIVVAVIVVFSLLLWFANSSYDRFKELYDTMMVTPANVHKSIIEFINEQNFEKFDGKLKVARTKKEVGDAYSAKHKVLILTDQTLHADSIGAFSIVAHELGHAEQDFTSKVFKRRKILHGFGVVLGKLFVPAIIAALVLLFFEDLRIYSFILVGVAGGIFLFALLSKLLTVRLEKDASRRAIKTLNEFIPENEMKEVKRFLKSARMTYWSDFVRLLLSWSGLVRKTKMF